MKPHGFLSLFFLFLFAAGTVAATTLPRQASERQYRPPEVVRVGGHVQATKLIHRVMPVYPPDAKKKGIQGTVVFKALIGKNGHVEKLVTVSGEPILVKAARTAVQQWVYKPTRISGKPVSVETRIAVIFTLGGSGATKLKSEGH
jgi:TonB family protein